MRIYSRGKEYTIGKNGTIDEKNLFKVLMSENDESEKHGIECLNGTRR